MKIVGLSGFARTGKDETANALVAEHGYQRVAFADKLRDFVYALNPVICVGIWEYVPHAGRWVKIDHGIHKTVYLQDVIDQYTWLGYKETPYSNEIRRLLQRVGTEAGRQVLWDSIWIDAALTGFDDDAKVVVTDARFYNEFDAIRALGGEIWRIERPGVGPLNEHASENEATDYPHFALTIDNDGTLEDLTKKVAQHASRL